VRELTKRAQTQENWARIYWLADGSNDAAQRLYKNLGVKLDFSLHIMPLGA
jgi:RimJ/RimL family protein N-acetyltransferase